MQNKKNYVLPVVLALIAIVIITAAIHYSKTKTTEVSNEAQNSNSTTTQQNPSKTPPSSVGTGLFSDSRYGFTFKIPTGFTVENPSKTQHTLGTGISLYFPKNITTGTNLATDSSIDVHQKTNIESCKPAYFDASIAFGNAYTFLQPMTVNGKTFVGASIADAAAGSQFEHKIYMIQKGTTCYAIALNIHTHDIGLYDPGTIKAYDVQAVDALYTQILSTFGFR